MIPLHPSVPGDWRDDAVCARRDVDRRFWYTADLAGVIVARAVCVECPVRQPCLRDGLHDEWGVWAGWTPHERARLRKQLRRTSDPDGMITRAAEYGPKALNLSDPHNPDTRKAT